MMLFKVPPAKTCHVRLGTGSIVRVSPVPAGLLGEGETVAWTVWAAGWGEDAWDNGWDVGRIYVQRWGAYPKFTVESHRGRRNAVMLGTVNVEPWSFRLALSMLAGPHGMEKVSKPLPPNPQ